MLHSAPIAVSAHSVARRFAGKWALRGVTVVVKQGEVLAIKGSNGSGKSTLLRIIATALRLTRGECQVFGHDVMSHAREVRPHIALLGHAPALYHDLTIAENLRFSARMSRISDDPRKIAVAIAAVGLTHAAGERARILSSGMQRRVAIARLMMREPRLLLLDEPYNSLDAEGIVLVDQLIRATRAAGGATMIVTHELERIEGIADNVATMSEGVLHSADTPAPSRTLRALPHPPLRLARELSR